MPVHSRTVSGLLIVNADDWGASRHTTERIATSFAAGGVSSATAMVYMADSERAAGRALEIGLPTGLHLNLTQAFDGPSVPVRVRETQRHLAARLGKLHRRDRLLLDPRLVAPVRVCVSEQLDCFRSLYGRDPTHLDGHNHVHLDPVVLCVLPRRLRLRTAVRSARIRSPGDLPRMLRHQFIQAVHGTTDFYFSATALIPAFGGSGIERCLELARDRSVELMTHPGQAGEDELLRSEEWLALLRGPRLGSFADLTSPRSQGPA